MDRRAGDGFAPSLGLIDKSWKPTEGEAATFKIPARFVDRFPFNRVVLPDLYAPVAASKRIASLDPLDVRAGLEPFSAPLDRIRAAHLLRRTSFDGSPPEVQAWVGAEADAAVDAIVDNALYSVLPDPPEWVDEALPQDEAARDVYFNQQNPQWLMSYYVDLMAQVYDGGLQERMMLFWHDHFVTQLGGYLLAPYAYRYVTTLREHALGNFKTFVHAVGRTPAMLWYLNGTQNIVGEPNENYARELLELFTMGQFDRDGNENYTQSDIENIARALTGWIANPFDLSVQFVSIFHDFGDKTIFGRTGNWDYDDVVDILFEERRSQIAEFIARKLYTEFVYAVPDEDLAADIAQVLLDRDFEIAPVVRTLLKSAHFFDEPVVAAQVKSPVSLLMGILRSTGTVPVESQYLLLYFGTFLLGQRVLDPPNVAGWEGHHAWLDTTTLPTRWLAAEAALFGDQMDFPSVDMTAPLHALLDALEEPVDTSDPTSVFTIARVLAEHFLAVPLDTLDLNTPPDGFAGDLINNPIPEEFSNGPPHVLDLTKIFLLGIVPWYDWRLSIPEAPIVLLLYARSLMQLPEFQLT